MKVAFIDVGFVNIGIAKFKVNKDGRTEIIESNCFKPGDDKELDNVIKLIRMGAATQTINYALLKLAFRMNIHNIELDISSVNHLLK